jgi:hypothetical protein
MSEIRVADPYPEFGPLLPWLPGNGAVRSVVCSSCFYKTE